MRSMRQHRNTSGDAIGAAIVVAITLIIASVHVYAHRNLYFAPPVTQITPAAAAQRVDDLQSETMIRTILQGDRKRLRLLDVWPAAPRVMAEAARAQQIDMLLLPCIARTEGLDERMVRFCNPYGLEYGGELIDYSRYDDGFLLCTIDAAELLAKMIPDGDVNIPALAHKWCPVNERYWSANVGAIYERALVQMDLIRR